MGRLGDSIIFASETVALDVVGAELVRSIDPGELVIAKDGAITSHRPFNEDPAPRPCIFEYVYFSRPDSIVENRSVYSVRKAIGAQLAIESPVDADLVVPVPDSACPRRSAMRRNRGFPSSSASSARTTSGAPSSSRAPRSAASASSSSTTPIAS